MKIVFLSNYMNHHQLHLCNEWYKISQGNFYFIATTETPEFRLKVGYKNYNSETKYVIQSYSAFPTETIKDIINSADIVIVGGISMTVRNNYLSERNQSNKVIIAYEERFFKGDSKHIIKNLLKFLLLKRYYAQFKNNNNYSILAASAYMKKDCKKLGIKKNVYAWGYFPFFHTDYFEKTNNLTKTILWVGRFIPYKHPEMMLLVARYLKKHNCNAQVVMIGDGPLLIKMKKKVLKENLSDKLFLLGSKDNDEVIKFYQCSEIFVCTSDADEGWGAVMNEAMAAKCAVIADVRIGSVPFLIQNGVNGFSYRKKNELLSYIDEILRNETLLIKIQNKAFDTITTKWNYKYAASKSYSIFEALLSNNKIINDDDSEIEPCTLL